ncbi:hypothetical protein [Nocardiopsis coralliicola]
MADAWMPGAGRVKHSFTPGGPFLGGAPRAVWRTTGTDPRSLSARSVAQRLDGDGRSAHIVWNPLHGDVAQLLPATAPATGQLASFAPASAALPSDRSTDAAREGRTCLVIVVIGYVSAPFTDGPLEGAGTLLEWLDSWGVPRTWPAGQPPAAARVPDAPRIEHSDPHAVAHWNRGGHFGASQVPGCPDSGPGAIDTERLLAATAEHREPPVPPALRPTLSARLPIGLPAVVAQSENGAPPSAQALP